jgi:SpoU rRNA methylase family enzyme
VAAGTVYARNRILLPAERRVATMITTAFGVGVAAAVLTAATSHAAHAAVPAAAVKHRVAAATDASVNRGHT